MIPMPQYHQQDLTEGKAASRDSELADLSDRRLQWAVRGLGWRGWSSLLTA